MDLHSAQASAPGRHRYPSIRRWPQTPPSAAVPVVRYAQGLPCWVEFLRTANGCCCTPRKHISRGQRTHRSARRLSQSCTCNRPSWQSRRGMARRMQLPPNRLLAVCIPWHAEPEFALVGHSARRGMARRMQLAPRRLLAVCIPWHAGPEF